MLMIVAEIAVFTSLLALKSMSSWKNANMAKNERCVSCTQGLSLRELTPHTNAMSWNWQLQRFAAVLYSWQWPAHLHGEGHWQ